jgi:hypothetical protein
VQLEAMENLEPCGTDAVMLEPVYPDTESPNESLFIEPPEFSVEPLTDHQMAEPFVLIDLDLTEKLVPSIESCDDIFVPESEEAVFIEAPEFPVESLCVQQPVESPNLKQLELPENLVPSIERSEDILVEVFPFEEALFVKAPDCYVESLFDHQLIESPVPFELELTEDSVPTFETSDEIVQEPSRQIAGSAEEIERPTEHPEPLIGEGLEEIRPQLELTPITEETALVENLPVQPPQLPEKIESGHGIFSRMCENSKVLAKVYNMFTQTPAEQPKVNVSMNVKGGKKDSLTWETLNDSLEMDDSSVDDLFNEICKESDIPQQPLSQTETDSVFFKELIEGDSFDVQEDDQQARIPVQLEPRLAEQQTFDVVSLKMKWRKLLVKCKCNRPEHVFFHLPDSEDVEEQEAPKPVKAIESVDQAVEETVVQKGKKRKISDNGDLEERLLEQETGTDVKILGAKKRKIHQPDPVPAQESIEVTEVPAVCQPQEPESAAALEQLSSKQSEVKESVSHPPDVVKLEEATPVVCNPEYVESADSEAHVGNDPANDSGFHEPKVLNDREFLDAVGDEGSQSEELDLDTESTSTAFSDLFPRSDEESEVDEELFQKEKEQQVEQVEPIQPKVEPQPQLTPKVEPQPQLPAKIGSASRLISFFNQLSGRASSALQSAAGRTLPDSTGSRKSSQLDIQPQVKEQKPEESISKSADSSVPPQMTEEKPEPEPRLNLVTPPEETSNKSADSPVITKENETNEGQNKNLRSLSRIVAQFEGAINKSGSKVAVDSQEKIGETKSKSEPRTLNPLVFKFEEAISRLNVKAADLATKKVVKEVKPPLVLGISKSADLPGYPEKAEMKEEQIPELPSLNVTVTQLKESSSKSTDLPAYPQEEKLVKIKEEQTCELASLDVVVTQLKEFSSKVVDLPSYPQEEKLVEIKEEQTCELPSLDIVVTQLKESSSKVVDLPSYPQEEKLVEIKEEQTHELPSLDVVVTQSQESTSSSQLIDDLPVDPEGKAEKRVKSRYFTPVSVKDENLKESVGAGVKGDGPHANQVTVRFQSSEAIAGEMYGQEVECACKICQSVEYSHCRCKQDESYETELVVPVRCTCGHETLLTELLVSAICPCGQEHTEESSECALGLKVVDTLNHYGNSTECYCGQYAYEDEDEFFECCECECEHHECPETVDQHPERYECEETLEEEDAQERLSVCSCDHHGDEEEMDENFGQVECTGATECACEHPDCFQQCEQLCQHAGCLCEHYEALQHSEECFQENDRQCEHQKWAESELEESSLASRRKSSALSVKFLLRVKKHCKCRTESAGVNLSSSSCTKKHSSIQRVVHSFARSKYSSLNADKDVAKKVTK